MQHDLADNSVSARRHHLAPQPSAHGLPRWIFLPALLGLLAAPAAEAQSSGFTGVFDSANWVFSSGGLTADGTISGSTLTLLGSLNSDNGITRSLYSIDVAESYRISFDWTFTGYDPAGPSYDPVGFTRAADYQLSDGFGEMFQSGSVTDAFFSGGTFSFFAESDNWSGEDGASLLTITNFSFTIAGPEDDGTDNYGGGGGGDGGDGGDGGMPDGAVAWTGATDGDWTQAGNWDLSAPTATQIASIVNGDAVTLTGVGNAHSLYLLADSSLTISEGGSLTLDSDSSHIFADYDAALTVTGEGSALVNQGTVNLGTATFLVDDHATATTGDVGLSNVEEDTVSTATVSNNARWTLGTLTIGGVGTATVNVQSGGTLEAVDRIYVSNGALNIDSGGTVTSTYGGIGDSVSTGSAHVTVDGAGSTWTIDGGLDIGSTGTGTLTISDGAVVTNNGANIGYFGDGHGTVTVTGAGSTWFTRGTRLGISDGTEGHLIITNGGVVTNSGNSIGMANSTGAIASVTITGAGSQLNGSLQVGNSGTATLFVGDGGKINGSSGSIGGVWGGVGTATVTGKNSEWTMTSIFTMDNGSSLTIADGARLTSGGSLIDGGPAGTSTITIGGTDIDGIGSSWADSSTVVIGYSGSAMLTINDDASVSTALWMRLGQESTSQGTLIQTGGTLDIGTYFQFNLGTPVYRLEGGVLKVGDTSFAGIQSGAGNYTFELAGGTIEAKGSSLTIEPDATLRNGTTTTLHTPGSASQILYFEGVLSGSGALRKTGAGALYLDAVSNTFSGGLTIHQGIVNPYYAASLGTGALTFSGDSTLQVDASSMSIANAAIIDADVTATLDVASPRTLTYTGNITGSGALTKTSAGTLVLSGTNAYAGPTRVAAGTLIFAKTASFYNGDSAQWTDANLVVESGATASFRVGGEGEFTSDDMDAFRALGSASGGFKNGATLGLDTTNASGGFTYASLIGDTNDGANSLGIAKTGVGTLTLTGANTYTGGTTITGGILAVGHASALGTGVIRLNGGTLQTDGAARTLANALDLIASNSTLGGAGDLTFNGLLRNTLASNLTLNVTNTGATTFGNVSLSGSGNRTLTFNTSGGPVAITGLIANGAGNSGLTKSGSGTLTLSGANTYSGNTTVSAGTLRATTSASALGTGALIISGTGSLSLANDTGLAFGRNTTVSATTANFTSDVLTNANAGVTHTLGTLSIGAQTLRLNKGANVGGGTAGLAFGAVTMTGNSTFEAGAGTRLTLASVTRNSGTRNATFTGGGDIVSGAITTATGSLTKSGSGSLTLTGTNTYTGVTSVNAGKLFVNGSIANTAVTVASGATLGGSGSIGGSTTIQSGAHLAAGTSPGTLTFTNGLALASGSFLDFELGENSDLIRVSGGVFSGPGSGTITVNITDSGGFEAGIYMLFNATGATLSSIGASSFEIGEAVEGYTYEFSESENYFFLTATAVPEPAAFAGFAGLAALGLAATRRRVRTAPSR